MTARWKTLIVMAVAAAAVVLPAITDPVPRLIWNASASVPVGLYAVQSIEQLTVGDVVLVEPPRSLARFLSERGYLDTDLPLLKHVAALPGAEVCRRRHAITIDGEPVAIARTEDRRRRPLPVWRGCRRLGEGEIFLMNRDRPDSFDGRYFGPLPHHTVIGRAAALWTSDED